MARQVPARNGGTLTRPDKGETMNRKGRPRKYVSELKEQGYKLSEVNDAIQVLMSMDEKELDGVLKNKNATILEKTIAKAMKTSLKKGSLYSLETLLTRVYGKPRETVDQTITGDVQITLNLNEDNVQPS